VLAGVRLERRRRKGFNQLGRWPVCAWSSGSCQLGRGMAFAMLSVTVCKWRVNRVRVGGRRRRDHSGGGTRLT
jgi:hypothetical protein